MKKEETLAQIKEAERQAAQAKEAASAQREGILRDARRAGFELRESLRRTAEQRQEEVLREADASAARETQKILATGQRDADVLKREAEANVERAVSRLVEKFKGAVNA